MAERDKCAMVPTEDALIAAAQAGDKAAFVTLTEAHAKRVYALAYRRFRSHEDADDVTQETLIRAFKYLGSFRQNTNFGGWLYRIAVNCCISCAKRRHQAQRGEAREVAGTGPGSTGPEWTDAIATSARVAEELERLPARQRTAIVLFSMEGLSVSEAAEAMGCSPGTVKRHLHRARSTLRERLADLVQDASPPPGGGEHELQGYSGDVGPAGGQRAPK